jgi:hypothetical protein
MLAVALAGDGAHSKGTLFAHIFHKQMRFSRVLKNARPIGRHSSINKRVRQQSLGSRLRTGNVPRP